LRAFSSRHNGVTTIFPETIWGGSVQNGLRRLEPASDAVFVLVPGGGVEPPRGVNLGSLCREWERVSMTRQSRSWIKRTKQRRNDSQKQSAAVLIGLGTISTSMAMCIGIETQAVLVSDPRLNQSWCDPLCDW